MIYDKRDVLSDSQALSTGTVKSTSYKDLGGDFNFGVGEPMGVALLVNTGASTSSGSGTFTFELETDDNASFSSPTVFVSRTIAGANLTEGTVHVLPIPADKSCQRYLEGKYILQGGDPLITITAVIMPVKGIPQTNIHYAAGSSVGT